VDITTVAHPPTPDTRELRALALYRERGRDIVLIGRDRYEVPSQDGTRVYEVVYGGEVEICTCPDFVYRNVSCVHLLAVGVCRAKRRGTSDAARPTRRTCRQCGGYGRFFWGAADHGECGACRGVGRV
jgi:hypothetical protein